MPETAPLQSFDGLADYYDLLVDWPKRLEREGPFFKGLFADHRVERVADVACGTGHHAALFHSWGLFVEGSDISEAMLSRCRQLHGENDRLQWVQQSFLEPREAEEQFDAVVCLGNSLALAVDLAGADRAIDSMAGRLRPGGVAVIQILNAAAIEEGPTVWQKIKRVRREGRPKLLLKGLHRHENRGFVDILQVDLAEDPIRWRGDRATFSFFDRDEMVSMIRRHGGEVSSVFGSYAMEAFQPSKSADLIVAWRRSPHDDPDED